MTDEAKYTRRAWQDLKEENEQKNMEFPGDDTELVWNPNTADFMHLRKVEAK